MMSSRAGAANAAGPGSRKADRGPDEARDAPDAGRSISTADRDTLATLVVITLIGTVLRCYYLSQPMRFDEAYTYLQYASQPLRAIIGAYSQPNNHIFSSILIHEVTRFAGHSPAVIRLPAFAAGVALIPATYLAARVWYGSIAAVAAAGLVATSVPLVFYSTNARGYSIVCLLTMVLVALAGLLRRGTDGRAWRWFAILAALAMYTVPTAIYALGGIICWMILLAAARNAGEYRRVLLRRGVPALFFAVVLTSVLYLPVVVESGWAALVANQYVVPESWSAFGRDASSLAGTVLQAVLSEYSPSGLLLLAGMLGTGLWWQRRDAERITSPLLPAIVFGLVYTILARRVPFLRVLLFLVPLAALTIGAGLQYCCERADVLTRPARLRAAICAILLLVVLESAAVAGSQAVYRSDDTGTLRDGQALARTLQSLVQPHDLIVASIPSTAPLDYYLQNLGVPYVYRCACLNGHSVVVNRLYVVVNTREGQDLAAVLKDNGLDEGAFAAPRQVRRFRYSLLLMLQRKASMQR